jgi:hypothetical protein
MGQILMIRRTSCPAVLMSKTLRFVWENRNLTSCPNLTAVSYLPLLLFGISARCSGADLSRGKQKPPRREAVCYHFFFLTDPFGRPALGISMSFCISSSVRT